VERSLSYVAPELARRGHEVVVIGGDPAEMEPAFAIAGVAFVPAPTAVHAVGEVLKLRGFRPDVMHSHMTAADVAAVLSAPVVRAPLVSTLHFAKPRGRSQLRRWAWRALPGRFSAQIAISGFVAERCGTDAVVIPNGVPCVASSCTPPRERVVLVAQRLEPEKQTQTALVAWSRTTLGSTGWRLQIAGDGSRRRRLEELAQALGITSTVDFLGFVSDIPDRMKRAAILLATTPADGFGLSVVEAMAAELPVVAAGDGAHVELLRGLDAQLYEARDASSCAQTLEHLAGDEERRRAAAAEGRRRYLDHYTIERHVDRLLTLYEEVVASQGRPQVDVLRDANAGRSESSST
jgi:glycosyltransferase involved in cell wall biosynthesis